MEQLQNTWNIVHENFMVLYDVFVAFVGLNKNTEEYMHNIGFRSVSSDRYPIRRKWPDRCIPTKNSGPIFCPQKFANVIAPF